MVESVGTAGVELLELSSDVFEKIAYGDRYDGMVAVVRTPRRSLDELQLSDRPLIAAVEGVEKPGNLGAILRTADGAGIDAVLVIDPVIDLFKPNAIRASVAAVFNANVIQTTASEALEWIRNRELTIWAARPDAQHEYDEVNYRSGGVVLLGNEARGLTDQWHASDITPIALPMRGHADSLNVAATAAVLFYEAQRQRKRP